MQRTGRANFYRTISPCPQTSRIVGFRLFIMPRALAALIRFLVGALIGCLLLAVVGMLLGTITLAVYRHAHPESGLGAVAGGFSEAGVFLVPLLSGILAVLLGQRSRQSR